MQTQAKKTGHKEEQTTPADKPSTKKTEAHDEAVADIDSLLDEIDGVLEENAQEFVSQYKQAGGE